MSKNWSFVLFSFCIWFYVFTPGSHCFAIDKFNRSAICTIHFRSIWTAPLWFSTCRSWAGRKVNATKLGPTKIRVPPSQLDFQIFLTFFIFFTFFPSAFSKRIFSHFSKCISKTHLFRIVFTVFRKNAKKCVLKMRLKKYEKCAEMWKTCEHMWTNVKEWNKRQLKSSCFLAPCFPFFPNIVFFQVFFENQC